MGEDELKVGMMIKRSQQKKSFGPVNYKERVFVLTRAKLSYYDGTEQSRGKIKGSMNLDTISYVGSITDNALNRTSAFQIIHGGVYLYCCAKNQADRDSWIASIKNACAMQCGAPRTQMMFHPSIFNNGKWQCCGNTSKSDKGCRNVNELNEEKYNKPLPDLPPAKLPNSGDLSHPPTYPSNSMSAPRSYGFNVCNNQPFNASQSPIIPPKPALPGNGMASRPVFPSNSFNGPSSKMASITNMQLPLPPNPSMPTSSSFNQIHSQRRNTVNFNADNSFSSYNPGVEQSINGQDSIDDEPQVPSYPHYLGAKHNENVVQSKSYEHTTPQYIKDTPKTEDSRVGKTVVALYAFDPVEPDDIELHVGEQYTVIDDSRSHWWYVKNKHGGQGYVPANYVQEEDLTQGIETMSWFQKDMSRQRAEHLLRQEPKEGNFIIRNSTQPSVVYTLSVVSKGGSVAFHVKHYHIKANSDGLYYLSEKHAMPSVLELVNYHKHNAGGLITRLRNAPACLQSTDQPTTHLFSNSKWEIDYKDLHMMKELGSGQFGKVRLARYRNRTLVAVKIMKENAMEEDSFIEEAEVMTRLSHQNLVCLYGVVTKQRPICIVTEFMENGCLLEYIRGNAYLQTHPSTLLEMCHQVCAAMQFLEAAQLIHRDLAARNCLVGKNMLIKVADFGLTRFVLDDEYTSSLGSKFPIKWAAPEVLNYTKFSSKSDVWAFGVLMWELFTGGKMPFAALSNTEVVDQVARGLRLQKPPSCPPEVYKVMLSTWEMEPERRPSFEHLFSSFYELIDKVSANSLPEGMYDA